MKDTITIRGRVRMVMTHADGTVEDDAFDNLITTAGREHAALRMLGVSQAPVSHVAVGTGIANPAVGNTALETEVFREAAAVSGYGPTIVLAVTLGPGEGTGDLTEAGVFNAASAGMMLSRVRFTVKQKPATSSLSIHWTITFS